jgi:hypothetical protein
MRLWKKSRLPTMQVFPHAAIEINIPSQMAKPLLELDKDFYMDNFLPSTTFLCKVYQFYF